MHIKHIFTIFAEEEALLKNKVTCLCPQAVNFGISKKKYVKLFSASKLTYVICDIFDIFLLARMPSNQPLLEHIIINYVSAYM